MRSRFLALQLLLSLTLAACGQVDDASTPKQVGPGRDQGETVITDGGPPLADSSAVEPTITPSLACDQYLSCLAAAQPEAFPAALQIYQPDGPCWESTAAAENCEKACAEGLAKLSRGYWELSECLPEGGVSLFAGSYRVEEVAVEEDGCGLFGETVLPYLHHQSCEVTLQGPSLIIAWEIFDQVQQLELELEQQQISGEVDLALDTWERGSCSYPVQISGEVVNPEQFTLTFSGNPKSCGPDCPYRVQLTVQAW